VARIRFENFRFNGSHRVSLRVFDRGGKRILSLYNQFNVIGATILSARAILSTYEWISRETRFMRIKTAKNELDQKGFFNFIDGTVYSDGSVTAGRSKIHVSLKKAQTQGVLHRGVLRDTKSLHYEDSGKFWISESKVTRRYTGLFSIFNNPSERIAVLSDSLDGDIMRAVFDYSMSATAKF